MTIMIKYLLKDRIGKKLREKKKEAKSDQFYHSEIQKMIKPN